MIDTIHEKCKYPGCTISPSFNKFGENPEYCATHKSGEMIDTANRKCKYPGCLIQPHFGYQGASAEYCISHKLTDMIDVIHKSCIYPNCKIRPSFGYKGNDPIYCVRHKLESMIDVVSDRCKHEDCMIRPTFGYSGASAEYCVNHKLDDMIDTKHKLCEYPNCNIRPSFGYQGEVPKYCVRHKLESMIDVINDKCKHEDCMIRPTFGYSGESVEYCVTHKLEGMIDLKHKLCEYPNCNIRPSFGYQGEEAKYCDMHKLKSMIDVSNRKCQYKDCMISPTYSKLYSTTRGHCQEHSTLNEYSYKKSKPTCCVIGCVNIAYFIDPTDINIYPVRCETHKFPSDIQLMNRICPNCNEELYFPNNRHVCMNCGLYREYVLHNFKEMIIKYFLSSNKISAIHNRSISPNGSKYRPDFLIEGKFCYIILEVDEYQHKRDGYNSLSENNRMKAIYQDIQSIKSNKQVLFIRYNPDDYKGLQQNRSERHSYLYLLIKHFTEIPINIPLGKIMLYYDGFNGSPVIEPIL
jgi:hypothetical protein